MSKPFGEGGASAPNDALDAYEIAWRDLERRRMYPIVATFVTVALRVFDWVHPSAAFRLLSLAGIAASLALAIYALAFTCPRCGWRFAERGAGR